MAVKPILLLGNRKLFDVSKEVSETELPEIEQLINDLRDTLINFRKIHHVGRAIAAPQIDVFKRVVYMHTINPVIFINPSLHNFSDEKIELWDDCMSFPNLLVKVRRAKECSIRFKDLSWNDKELILKDDLSELLQHECDHLDGILAVERAIDYKSFALKSEIEKQIQ